MAPKPYLSPLQALCQAHQVRDQVLQARARRVPDGQVLDQVRLPLAVRVGQVKARREDAPTVEFAARCQAAGQQAHPSKLGLGKRFEQEMPGSEDSSSAQRLLHRSSLGMRQAWESQEVERADPC